MKKKCTHSSLLEDHGSINSLIYINLMSGILADIYKKLLIKICMRSSQNPDSFLGLNMRRFCRMLKKQSIFRKKLDVIFGAIFKESISRQYFSYEFIILVLGAGTNMFTTS